METALQQMREMVSGAKLSAEVQHRVLWALDQLPPLYRDLERTYDVRYRDGVLGHVQGIMKTLAAAPADCPGALPLLEGLVSHFQTTHAQLGIPTLGLKVPPPKKLARGRKTA